MPQEKVPQEKVTEVKPEPTPGSPASPTLVPSPTASPVPPPTPLPKPIPPKVLEPEYDYQAALAAWAADYAAEVNRRTKDDGVCKYSWEFEWVMKPFIKDGEVRGASQIWQTNVFYAGEYAERTIRSTVNTSYDASNPGAYTTVGELRRKYPQFERK